MSTKGKYLHFEDYWNIIERCLELEDDATLSRNLKLRMIKTGEDSWKVLGSKSVRVCRNPNSDEGRRLGYFFLIWRGSHMKIIEIDNLHEDYQKYYWSRKCSDPKVFQFDGTSTWVKEDDWVIFFYIWGGRTWRLLKSIIFRKIIRVLLISIIFMKIIRR